MTVQTAQFVDMSDIFEGYPNVAQAFAAADNHPFTWGDNNRSLVSKERFKDTLDEACEDDDNVSDDDLTVVKDRIDSIPDDVYIDLEN